RMAASVASRPLTSMTTPASSSANACWSKRTATSGSALGAAVEHDAAHDVPTRLEGERVGAAGLTTDGRARPDGAGAHEVRLGRRGLFVAVRGVGEGHVLAGVLPDVGPQRVGVGGLHGRDLQEVHDGAAGLGGVLEGHDVGVGLLVLQLAGRDVGPVVLDGGAELQLQLTALDAGAAHGWGPYRGGYRWVSVMTVMAAPQCTRASGSRTSWGAETSSAAQWSESAIMVSVAAIMVSNTSITKIGRAHV